MSSNPKIHVAFRFHVNLYHSYRADTLDEKGLGKDIRIMGYCLDTLDRFNKNGIPAKGAWDIENYYSLQRNMPALCPELIGRIRDRVQVGMDEVELMSYNNGILSAHTAEEAEVALKWAISNPDGSGLKDIFGKHSPIVRPQECMLTPSLMKTMNKVGIEAVSIYYSCIPFNGFSSFVPLLRPEERHNILWLTAPGFDERIKLIPAINPGDAYENGGIANMVKRLRKHQISMQEPKDMLVLLDMDADDDFWQGYINTMASFAVGLRKPAMNGGLGIFISKLSKLPYVQFTTPGEYLATHEPLKTVCFGQDTADGGYDSYAPWTDKLENKKLFTAVERNRLTNDYAREICGEEAIEEAMEANLPARILPLSTTHFGLSTPVMCKPRLLAAFDMVKAEQEKSDAILKAALARAKSVEDVALAVYPRRYFRGNGQKNGLIRLAGKVELTGDGIGDSFSRTVFGKEETVLIYRGEKNEIKLAHGKPEAKGFVKAAESTIENGSVKLAVVGGAIRAYFNGNCAFDDGSFETSIKYGGKTAYATGKKFSVHSKPGIAYIEETGNVFISSGKTTAYTKVYSIFSNLPYFYIDAEIRYPMTGDHGAKKRKVEALYRGYDTRWQEIMPLELIPAFSGSIENPLRIYKHNFMGSISYFDLDYFKFTPNKQLQASNNAVTCSFVAVSAKDAGVLVAQSVSADYAFAFAPMRFSQGENGGKLKINPFGVYGGEQLRYNLTRSGIAAKLSTLIGASYMSCAPTYRGGTQQLSLMVAPFSGGSLRDELVNDAIAFSYPPNVSSKSPDIKMIEFAGFDNCEPLG